MLFVTNARLGSGMTAGSFRGVERADNHVG
jgi:hypothetical protein